MLKSGAVNKHFCGMRDNHFVSLAASYTPRSVAIKTKIFNILAIGTLVLFLGSSLNAQQDDCQSISINKTVREFPNEFNLSSPINSFVTFKYLKSNGKEGLYRSVNSYKIQAAFPDEEALDIQVEGSQKRKLLNTKINKVLIYKDAVAGVLTDFQPPMQIITYLTLEDGKWLNAGEDLGNDLADARVKFMEKANIFLEGISRIEKLKIMPKDPLSFTSYLKENGKEPEEFILQALSEHKIVIYGELHRRQASWKLLKRLIRNPEFPAEVGTVFMELSSDKQAALDRFYGNGIPDKELLLDIFRDVQINGWYDRGMYEFLIELWNVNEELSPDRKIKIIAVDEPRPFRTFKTFEQMEAHFNQTLERNDQMAEIISRAVRERNDQRNNLFIVGVAHAYKSKLQNLAIGSRTGKMKPTAASQLAAMFPDGEVFTIFQHIPIGSNNGITYGLLRHGAFDKAFSESGNKPVAFLLKGSPFGKEPFDALNEISYKKLIGTYGDNFDAYLFLGPLETESDEYIFDEIITDDFLIELNRRAIITKTTLENWFGVDKATVQAVKETLQFDPGRKRWPEL